MAASASGSVIIVRAILDLDGDVNAIDVRHNHAAHFASTNGHFEVLACLSAFGANFDQINAEENTPIHLAAMNGHAMCIKFLSQRGELGCFEIMLNY